MANSRMNASFVANNLDSEDEFESGESDLDLEDVADNVQGTH